MGKERPPYYFLICPDSALLLDQLEASLKKWPPANGKWERRVYWGDEPQDDKFWNDLSQQGLFAINRAIIARHSEDWPAQTWKSLSSFQPAADLFPFFCLEGAFEKGKPKIPAWVLKSDLYQKAEKNGWIWLKPPLSESALLNYAREEARKAGLKLSPECMELLCSSVLPEASSIKNEVRKLALIARDAEITPELMAMDASTPDADAFACSRLLLAGKLPETWRELRRSDDSMLFLLLALLAREFRIFWQILAGEKPPLYPKDAAAKNAQAQKMGFARLSDAFALLAEAEWNVKSGQLSPGQSLEKMAIGLSRLCVGK